jgi:hypothetical protein
VSVLSCSLPPHDSVSDSDGGADIRSRELDGVSVLRSAVVSSVCLSTFCKKVDSKSLSLLVRLVSVLVGLVSDRFELVPAQSEGRRVTGVKSSGGYCVTWFYSVPVSTHSLCPSLLPVLTLSYLSSTVTRDRESSSLRVVLVLLSVPLWSRSVLDSVLSVLSVVVVTVDRVILTRGSY